MHFLQIISLVFSLVMFSHALPQGLGIKARPDHIARSTNTINGVLVQDFLISDMELLSSALPNNLGCNHTLSFVFTDPNSNNTSTKYDSSWTLLSNGTNTAPFSFVSCALNGNQEFFDWQFNTYTTFTNFSIRFAHQFSDPVHYPPPFNFVEYFADAQINLVCLDAADTLCGLPDSNNPLHAQVNRISD